MTLAEILALAAAVAVVWLIWDGLQAREIANAAMREACRLQGLLFLDDTVALESLAPARDDAGRLRLKRVFAFEYSDTGHDRHKGRLTMLGATIVGVVLGTEPHAPDDAVRRGP